MTTARPIKRTVDMQIIADWVEPRSRVLDLGCGRGVLLDSLVQSKDVHGIGVDLDVEKVAACIRRGLSAYQGDMMTFMRSFPDGHFDRVICSRTLEEVPEPAEVMAEALRVGRALTVGFASRATKSTRPRGSKAVRPIPSRRRISKNSVR
jgi:methionine biosynthesis protein MetW